MDFESHSPEAYAECKELVHKLLELILALFQKTVHYIDIQQCKQTLNKLITDY